MVMHRVLPWFPRYLLGPECPRFSGRCFEQQLFEQPAHRDLGPSYVQVLRVISLSLLLQSGQGFGSTLSFSSWAPTSLRLDIAWEPLDTLREKGAVDTGLVWGLYFCDIHLVPRWLSWFTSGVEGLLCKWKGRRRTGRITGDERKEGRGARGIHISLSCQANSIVCPTPILW